MYMPVVPIHHEKRQFESEKKEKLFEQTFTLKFFFSIVSLFFFKH